MKLIILAAGEGKRLRPYTEKLPKCLVNLKEKPLLSHQLSSIKRCNISDDNIALVGGYKSEQLDQFSIKTFINPKYSSTNMVSTLFCAKDFMKSDEDLVISYGDIIYEEKVLRTLLSSNAEMSVVADENWEKLWRLRMTNPLDDAETFIMDDNCLIEELGNKPNTIKEVQAQYIGLIKVRGDMVQKFKEIYSQIDKTANFHGQDFDNMYMTSFIQYLIDYGWQVKASLIKNGWIEVDTVQDLESYDQMPKKTLDSYCRLEAF